MAQSKKDIDVYKSDRYVFAKEMGHVWFEILAKMDAQTLQEFKRDLNGRTLIGEYIGSKEHQHLVKYSRTTIIFYAVVDHKS